MTTPYVLNKVKERSDVIGLNDIDLLGGVEAVFSTYLNDLDTVFYVIDDCKGNWESGWGRYDATLNTISRDVVISSSNADQQVNFGVSTKTITSALDGKIVQQLLELIPFPFW